MLGTPTKLLGISSGIRWCEVYKVSAEMNLYVSEGFFKAPDKGPLSESPSEELSREVLGCVFQIDSASIRKGNPDRKEPDCMLPDGRGIEVFWGESEHSLRQLDGTIPPMGMGISQLEFEYTIKSRIDKKVKKQEKGNYRAATNVSLCCILVTPVISWYFTAPEYVDCGTRTKLDEYAITRRELFWEALHYQYIESGPFENIYIICPTHDSQYICFDIKGYHNEENWFTLIASKNGYCLPFCEMVDKGQNITWNTQLAWHIIQVSGEKRDSEVAYGNPNR